MPTSSSYYRGQKTVNTHLNWDGFVTTSISVVTTDLAPGEHERPWPPISSTLGASLAKAFNHLPTATLAEDPKVEGGRRVGFLSSDDQSVANKVAKLVERLGFAPVFLGKLQEGGRLVQAQGNSWAPLIFQDLFMKGE